MGSSTGKIVGYVVLGSLIVLSVAFGIWAWYLKPPYNPCYNQSTGQLYPPQWNRPMCSFLTESYQDASIPVPSAPLQLTSFSYVSGSLNGGFCQPVHYAYRFVRVADGGYGGMSAWSEKVESCSTSDSMTGCNRNTPTLGLTQQPPVAYTSSDWVLNIHRQTGKLDPSSEGDIVGYLSVFPSPTQQGIWASFTDLGAVSPVSLAGTVCKPRT